MSKKITFRELIESIAEETDQSKQFTHDFLKDFVDVINGGLDKDGSVNIAGFGKFKLRRVDERDGYNPQTEEKMTIPAHNKIVFKPYKDVRELVNAPYAHLEPELIEEQEDNSQPTDEEESKEDYTSEEDFLPTAPPTAHEEGSEEESSQSDDSFEFTELGSSSSGFELSDTWEQEHSEQDEEDIVEFQGPADDEEELEQDPFLDDFIEAEASAEDENKNKQTEQNDAQHIAEELDSLEQELPGDQQEEPDPPLDFTKDQSTGKSDEFKAEGEKAPSPKENHTLPNNTKNSSLPILVAAASVLLLLVAGAWYLGILSESGPANMTPQQSVATAEVESEPSDNSEQSAESSATNNDQQQKNQQTARSTQDQSPQTTQAASTTSSEEEHAIEKGQTLWSLAEEKYGNPRLWPWIYGNNGSLNDPDLIIAGRSLSVPLPSGPQRNLTSGDSLGVAKGYLATYRWYKNNRSDKAKNHLWGALKFHQNVRNIADVKIDESDLSYVNNAR